MLLQAAHAQSKKTMESRIEKVTVFLDGAQTERTARASLAAGKQEIIFGGSTFPDSQVLIDTIKECTPRLELDYAWRMTLKSLVLAGGVLEYDGKLEGNMVLTGNFTKESLTSITNPATDLETSFVVDGSFIETYKTPKLTDSTVLPICGQIVIRGLTAQAGTMKVVPNFGTNQHSEVKFTFEPHYDPAALTQGGQQLCSFCPVFRKTPASVQLMLDPGRPTEKYETACGSAATPSTNAFWQTAWQGYYKAGVDYLSNWNIASTPDLTARKTISRSRQVGPTISTTEEAVFELKACTGLIEASPLGQKCTK